MSEESLSTSSSSSNQCSKRKIQLCRAFLEIGYCRYGQGCFFAHGVQELQIDQPILKSKICRNFHKHGHCKYGDRCNFRHETTRHCTSFRLSRTLQDYPEIITMVNNFRKKEAMLREQENLFCQ